MSIFKKIFGGASADDAKKTLKQRSPRVALQALHQISFRPVEPSGQKVFNLGNISTGGMAILHEGADVFKRDEVIRGPILFDREEIEINGIIRHRSNLISGCEFIQPPVSVKRLIERYLGVEISAMNLQRIADQYLKTDPRGQVIWFSDGKQNELYGVVDKDGLTAFHMSFLGNYIEGERGHAVRSGVISEQVTEGAPRHKGSSLVDMKEALSEDKLQLTLKFLNNIEKMPVDLLQQIEAYLHAK